MISLAIASLVVNLITLIGLYYNYKAVQYTKEQIDLLKDENSERNTWASKHEQAFSLVLKTDAWFTLNGTHQNGYPVVFSDSAFRILVETYIISFDRSRDVMSPRVLDAAQFGLPSVQKAIHKTIETVERFKNEHRVEATMIGLIQ